MCIRDSGGTARVPQGRGIFVPAGVRGLAAEGEGELLLTYPFQLP